jgi:thiamine pyrophosphate-dependent acetolactate synthase large subunit-like protein
MSVGRAIAELREALPAKTILLDHSTTAVRLVRESFPVPDGAQYLSASGSCQGWGIGAAIGVQLANPGVPVVGVVGDGGFMFGLQAVWTAAQYEIPLLAVVLNNGGWSSMRASLARNSPAVVEAGMDMHFGWSTDYGRLATEFGVDGVRVETPQQLRDLLRERLPLSRPLVLDVVCRREPKTSASPFVGY